MRCPDGHESTTTDYCDVCGTPMPGGTPAPPPVPVEHVAHVEPDPTTEPVAVAQPEATPCPACGTPRSGDDRFCEECGHDLSRPVADAAPAAVRWEVVVHADRAHYDRVAPTDIDFPIDAPDRTFALCDDEVRIGRASGSRDLAPEIDLGTPPVDPGISRLHAVLVRTPAGSWTITDTDSANGTTVNEGTDPIPVGVPVALAPGDRIHLGAWTTITLAISEPEP